MDLDPFKNISISWGADGLCRQSFINQQRAPVRIESSRPSKDTIETSNTRNENNKPSNRKVFTNIPIQKQLNSTPKGKSKSSRNQMAQKQFNKRQSRSQSVKGATNLSKETRLLKSKLDRLFDSYHQTVVATSQSQNTQMESLKIENQQLRTQLNELETETLQQFSELEDCAELLAALDEQRLASEKEAFLWKGECEKLAKEVIFLKETIDEHHNQRTSILPEWRFRNEKTVESLFKKPESNLDKKQIECSTNKENRIGMIACFPRRESSEHRSDDEICPSLIAARSIRDSCILLEH